MSDRRIGPPPERIVDREEARRRRDRLFAKAVTGGALFEFVDRDLLVMYAEEGVQYRIRIDAVFPDPDKNPPAEMIDFQAPDVRMIIALYRSFIGELQDAGLL